MKIILLRNVVFLIFFVISFQLYSQDILYKKAGTAVKVNISDFNGKTVTYFVPGEPAGRIYYISKSDLDSLRYKDGKSVSFPLPNDNLIPQWIKRNYLGVDIVNLLKGKPDLSFEIISKTGRRSYVAELFFDSKPDNYVYGYDRGILQYFNFNSYYFFTRLGVNFYPLNYTLAQAGDFRFSHGVSVLLGSYRKMDYIAYSQEDKKVFSALLLWNLNGRFYLGKYLQIQGGMKVSVLPLLKYLVPEVGVSIGF